MCICMYVADFLIADDSYLALVIKVAITERSILIKNI